MKSRMLIAIAALASITASTNVVSAATKKPAKPKPPTTKKAPLTKVATTAATTATTPVATTAPAAAAPATAASGPCDKSKPEVKVGVAYSLSGPLATLSADFLAGTEMAADDANTIKGGILGRCLKLVVKDDEGSATKGAQVVRQLVSEEKVAFMVGPYASGVLGGVLDFTNKEKVLGANATLFPGAGDASKYPYTYRLAQSSEASGADFAGYAKKKKWAKVGVLAVNTTLGTSTLDAFKKSLTGSGIDVSSVIFEAGTVDLTPALSKLQDSLPDAVYFFCTGGDLANAVKARATLKYFAPTVSYSTVADAAVVDAAGGAENMRGVVGEGFYLGQLRKANSAYAQRDAYSKFLDKLRIKKGEKVLKGAGNIPAGGYAGLDMFVVAANKTGSLDADVMKKYLDTSGYDGVVEYKFTSAVHDGYSLDALGFALATSLRDGTLEEAP